MVWSFVHVCLISVGGGFLYLIFTWESTTLKFLFLL